MPIHQTPKAYPLANSHIAELLAVAAESAPMPAQKALRAASRRAFIWPEEAADLLREQRSLTEGADVGPHVENVIKRWFDRPPLVPEPPQVRHQFLTITEAKAAYDG